jgi:glycosyltransferase involved in cell wall biosynthesis
LVFDVSIPKLVGSYVLTVALAMAFERWSRPATVSRTLLALLLVMSLVPILSFWALTDADSVHLSMMVLSYVLVLAASRIRFPQLRLPSEWGVWTLRVCAVAMAVTLVRLVIVVGMDRFSVDPNAAYTTRKLLSDVVSSGIWGYFNIWSFKVFPLALLTWALVKRRYGWALLVVAAVAVLFGFTGNRSSVLYPLAVVGIFLLRDRSDPALSLIRVLSGVTAVGAALSAVGISYWSSLLTRRLLYVPALLNFAYYRYFSDHGHVFMSNGVLGRFIDYPFSQPPPALIGNLLFPGFGTWSNTGFIGTSYMHFGLAGVVAFAIVVGAMIAMADRVGHPAFPVWARLAVLVVPFTSLFASADLGTSMLTHGLALSFFALATLSPGNADHEPRTRVAHISVVHRPNDVRIFHKQCRTLAHSGYDVTLIVPAENDETIDAVHIRALPVVASRAKRMTLSGVRALREAIAVDADLYHLHDPELLWVAVLLRMRGRIVVMDVHEDTASQILGKYWIPASKRRLIAGVYSISERLCMPFVSHVVTATEHLARMYPAEKTTAILNYPLLTELKSTTDKPYELRDSIITYAGGISRERGAIEMLDAYEIVSASRDVRFALAGAPSPDSLFGEMNAHPIWSSVDYRGWVDRVDLWELLSSARVGLLLFAPGPNHVAAGPNKMFEYMAARLPIVASDFPVWREIIKGERCGLVVDPQDPVAIADAIGWLLDHPEDAAEMGARGHDAVLSRYNWERESEKLLALYSDLFTRIDSAHREASQTETLGRLGEP